MAANPDGRRLRVERNADPPVFQILRHFYSRASVDIDIAVPKYPRWKHGKRHKRTIAAREAANDASSDRSTGFGPTRRAISRIAKEGRKYGVFLGVVSQRPAELDPTILSQCGTLFVMRTANGRDHAILRSAVSDAASNLLDFIPSLGTGEAFVFGEGVALPTQLQFAKLPEQMRPRNEALADRRMAGGAVDLDFIASVVERWRGTMASNRFRPEASPALPGASGIASNANPHGKFELHYK
jgi:uncharacterized protein